MGGMEGIRASAVLEEMLVAGVKNVSKHDGHDVFSLLCVEK